MAKVTKENLEGMAKPEAMDFLAEKGMGYAEATKFWAANKPEAGTGFKAGFYAELEKGFMDADAFDLFLADKSPNVRKNRANFDGVRKMANRIWEANS